MGISEVFRAIAGQIPSLIHQAESVFGAGSGAAKRAFVLDAVRAMVVALSPVIPDQIEVVINGVLTLAEPVVTAIVAVLNFLKVFKKS